MIVVKLIYETINLVPQIFVYGTETFFSLKSTYY